MEVTVQNALALVKYQVQRRFYVEPVFNFVAWVFPFITSEKLRYPLLHAIADKNKHLALADPGAIYASLYF